MEKSMMRKSAILDRPGQDTIKADLSQDLISPSITPDLLPMMAHEKANRQSRLYQLDVLEYQPCQQDSALPLIKSWHLLFFARTGTSQIQGLRTALQRESGRDVQLMKRFKSVQAQYRQHAARESQTVSESVASQPVIAEIRYGGLTIASGFWLPADMEMGLCLLPSTGGCLAAESLTVVEHSLDTPSASLDVLMVTLPAPRTKAEQAALQYIPGDGSDLARKHSITLSTPAVTLIASLFGVDAFAAATDAAVGIGVTAGAAISFGHQPTPPPSEESAVNLKAQQVRALGEAPSASQLLEARYQLMTRKK